MKEKQHYPYICFSAAFAVYAIYENFILPELQIPLIISLLYIALFIIFFKMRDVMFASTLSHNLSYSLFSVFLVIGQSFKEYGSFNGVWGNPFTGSNLAELLFEDFAAMFNFLNGPVGNVIMLLSSICKGIGYYFILQCTFESAKYFCKKHILFSSSRFSVLAERFFEKDAFLRVFLFLMAAWLPYLLMKFPGAVCNDAQDQIEEFLQNTLSSRHPLFLTFIYGTFAKLGDVLGSPDIGLFLFLLLQCGLMGFAFSYCIASAKALSQNNIVSILLVFLYAFSPAFPSFATTMLKDSLYCTFFILFVTELIWIIHELEGNIVSKKHVTRLAYASLLMCLTRNNGILMVLPAVLALLVIYFRKARHSAHLCRTVCILLLLPLILFGGFTALQNIMVDTKTDSTGEILSLPFQQTARYAKMHPEDITVEEASIIDRVLDYENLAELYNPIVSDPVKGTYKKNPSALPEYFRVWADQGKKHPLTYAEATIGSNYFLVYPDTANIRAYFVMDENLSNFSHPVLKVMRILLLAYVMGLSLIPVVSCLINPVFYVWGFIYIFIDSTFKKHSPYSFLILLPMLFQVINVILGPAVFNHPRYFYPVYWSIPFLAVFLYREQLSSQFRTCKSTATPVNSLMQ